MIELWMEGWCANEGVATADLCGVYEASSVAEAARMWAAEDDRRGINMNYSEPVSFWGCRFFDNEADARKAFG